jgi:hypothetical protein
VWGESRLSKREWDRRWCWRGSTGLVSHYQILYFLRRVN